MYAVNLKNWWENHHPMHTLASRVAYIVHDEHFWPGLLMIVLLGLFVGLLIWAGLYGEASPDKSLVYPFAPYTY